MSGFACLPSSRSCPERGAADGRPEWFHHRRVGRNLDEALLGSAPGHRLDGLLERARSQAARTDPPRGDRFVQVWCEAEAPDGTLISCPSPQPPLVFAGQACNCASREGQKVLLGRIVTRRIR
jgi:hypothetical protein